MQIIVPTLLYYDIYHHHEEKMCERKEYKYRDSYFSPVDKDYLSNCYELYPELKSELTESRDQLAIWLWLSEWDWITINHWSNMVEVLKDAKEFTNNMDSEISKSVAGQVDLLILGEASRLDKSESYGGFTLLYIAPKNMTPLNLMEVYNEHCPEQGVASFKGRY